MLTPPEGTSDARHTNFVLVKAVFSFPNPVNEVSARLVAGGVLVLCLLAIALDQAWLTAVIAHGFVARVLTRPPLRPARPPGPPRLPPRLPPEERPPAGAAHPAPRGPRARPL